MKEFTEEEKKEIIEVLKQLEGCKRKLHALLKGEMVKSEDKVWENAS